MLNLDNTAGWLRRFFPFMAWLPGVNRQDVKGDFIAGLTGAIVVLPQGVAFAYIAGMPPEYGLYAGIVPAIIAALFGSSRHLVSGPTTAASIVLLSTLSVYAIPRTPDYVSLALTLTFMVGVFELVLGLARMGVLVNFISHSVIVGFTAGAAILIGAKQLPNFFGITIPRGGHLHDILYNVAMQISNVNAYVLLVAMLTLISGVVSKKYWPKIPYMITAIMTGSLVSTILNAWLGQNVTGIATVGALPASLPPLSAPSLTLENIKNLAPAALAVSLFALTEAVSIGRSLASRGGYRINGNQEFIGQGLSNIAGAFFSGYVATGSFNRSGVNFQAGARTPLAAVFAAVLLGAVILVVAPLAAYLPNAAMAGVLFLVAYGLIDSHEIRHILKSSRRETGVLAVTFLSALFLELEFSIFAGVLLSLVLYLERVSKPRIVSRVPDSSLPNRAFTSERNLPGCPQLHIVRIDGSVFFGSVNHIETYFDWLRNKFPGKTHLAIEAGAINFVDLQGGELLLKEARYRKAVGGDLYLINVKEGLWNSLDKCGYLDATGARNIFQSKTAAIRAIHQKLDKSICATCKHRIFNECNTVVNLPLKPDPTALLATGQA